MSNVTDYSISTRINSPLGVIGKLANEFGQKDVLTLLSVFIFDTSDFFNVSRNMTDNQVKQTAQLILQEYYHLTIEDFKLFFDRVKLGKYGKLYGSFDGANILLALAEFDIDRENELIEYRKNKNKELKESSKSMDAISSEQLELLKQKFLVKEIPKPKPVREKTELEKLMDGYFKEFDLLFMKQEDEYIKKHGKRMTGQRFVDYKGRVVSVTEYCEIRVGE